MVLVVRKRVRTQTGAICMQMKTHRPSSRRTDCVKVMMAMITTDRRSCTSAVKNGGDHFLLLSCNTRTLASERTRRLMKTGVCNTSKSYESRSPDGVA